MAAAFAIDDLVRQDQVVADKAGLSAPANPAEMIQRGRWPLIESSVARRAAGRPGPLTATATILPPCSPSITGTEAD